MKIGNVASLPRFRKHARQKVIFVSESRDGIALKLFCTIKQFVKAQLDNTNFMAKNKFSCAYSDHLILGYGT